MGRRSRKRDSTAHERPALPIAAPRPPRMSGRKASLDEAPPAPWSPFPLVELCILAGIVMIVAGFAFGEERRGVLLACGFTLVSLASLELAVREHFAGYRSHSALLAATCAIAADVPLYFLTDLRPELLLVVGIAVFAAMFVVLRNVFSRRTGGLGFRA